MSWNGSPANTAATILALSLLTLVPFHLSGDEGSDGFDSLKILPCQSPPGGMSCIPGGPFVRGSNDGPENTRPRDRVWVQTFLMDINEVTYGEYQACHKAGKCPKAHPLYLDFNRPRQPMNGVSWYAASQYCHAHGKRLPTEAEWEKAARGTDERLYPWGNEPATCDRAVIKGRKGRGCGVKKKGSQPDKGRPWVVGSFPPGIHGLHDMAGNSWEWVSDWYTKSYSDCGVDCQGVNPKGPCGGKKPCPGHRRKIVRGGSWYWPASHATTIFRRPHYPSNKPFHHFGFRCAVDLSGTEALKVREVK